ncbi:hypothetical protein BRADI_2g34980v3 [Brachypodium distachyon]|uniref:Uncharacterized protein n=1 Tax=Brachypodium distachyon TaxID=15368 RepID=A0A2K2DBV3_BRADI|nr:hypothetical protein BRADI_2g34980v3 [Brachypodium distachyon]
MADKVGRREKERWQGESLTKTMKRVKVYRLEENGKWDDHGTGHATIDNIMESGERALAVVDEEDNDTLLLHNITPDDIYRKQEETIISWKDPEKALELALSFQEAEGCSFIWENMCNIREELQSEVLSYKPLCKASSGLQGLPPLELSNLSVILKTILEYGMKEQMRVIDLISEDRDFFPKIVKLFRTCEGLGDMDGLHMIFKLIKAIISLNSSAIFDVIFSDDLILDIIGALEYNPEVRNVQNHRAFLKEHAVFKEAIPIRNASVVSKIHQTYRINYIKDVILPPKVLDDATLASLNTMIHANNAFVVCLLKDDALFIQELFAKMRSSNISAGSKSELVSFLLEFCDRSKSLQPTQQIQLFRDLASQGVFDIISDVLQSQDKVLVSDGTGIILHFLNQDPNLLGSYIANQEENRREGVSLLGLLVQGMVTEFGGEVLSQFLEILKILLEFAPNTVTHCRAVIEFFYENHFDILVDVIESSCLPKSIAGSTFGSDGAGRRFDEYSAKPEILSNICEFLCFCVVHHPYKITVNFFTRNSMEKILTLTRRRERFLVVAAVRFMRTVIGRNDAFLISHVISQNMLKPIIEAFVENGDRYNMLHSGVLELLEYIRKENLNSLVVYVVESFWSQLLRFEHLKSIQAFKIKYQEFVESAETKQTTSVGHMGKADERGLDKDSNEGSATQTASEQQQSMVTSAHGSEIHHIPARPKSGGLVDYDDDAEDYNTSPKRPLEDDEALNIPMEGHSSSDGKNTDGKIPKKPKLDAGISFSNMSIANVAGRQSDLKDKQPLLSPVSGTENSGGNDDVGDGNPGSPIQQHAPESLDLTHKTGDDCIGAAGEKKMEADSAKATDSEPDTSK